MLKSEKMDTKNTAKTYLQKSHAGNPKRSGNESCGPLKQSKDPRTGNPDPRTGNLSGIRDIPLVPSGTVADRDIVPKRCTQSTISIGPYPAVA